MSFVFSPERAAQAASFFVKRSPGNMLTRGKLIKLLYLADRESLSQRGFPITGDDSYAMHDGPVLTQVYDLIKGSSHKPDFQEIWSRFFESAGSNVVLKADPGDTKLSENDFSILDAVFAEFGHVNFRQLSSYTHSLDEFKNSYRNNTSTRITTETMLDAIGQKADAERIERTKKFDQNQANLFGC